MNDFGKEKFEQKHAVLEDPEIQRFIKQREIKPEDFWIIETLAQVPQDFLIRHFHNHFNLNHERSVEKLERYQKINTLTNAENEIYNLYIEFTRKYDWMTSWHLNGILENR